MIRPTLFALCAQQCAFVAMVEAAAFADLSGRSAIVVGGTAGIGRGIALRLAAARASVTVVGRSAERGAEVVAAMAAAAGEQEPKPTFGFVACDAYLLANVAAAATSLRPAPAPLDVLVLTQGMATFQGFTPSTEGLDQKMTLHYWSRALFIQKLLPSLRAAPDARVLTVLSAGVHSAYGGYSTDVEVGADSYSLKNATDAAGFYNDIMVDSLSRDPDNKSVLFAHAAPGFVSTSWGTELPGLVRGLVRGLQVFGRSMDKCGDAMVNGLMAGSAGGFRLLDQDGKEGPVVTGRHEEAREAVWAHTLGLFTRLGVE